jgi:hypothetical protein
MNDVPPLGLRILACSASFNVMHRKDERGIREWSAGDHRPRYRRCVARKIEIKPATPYTKQVAA